MNLSKLLSKPPAEDFQQVDTFWFSEEKDDCECIDDNEDDATLLIGQHITLDVGQVSLNYYCEECEDMRTFTSDKEQGIRGIVVSPNMLSIDCVLRCSCNAIAHTWFLIEAKNDIRYQSPEVRISHFREKLSEGVKLQSEQYGEFSAWLEKARRAHRDGFGAGAVIYLRKIFEALTYNIASSDETPIPIRDHNGWRRSFKKILEDVDKKYQIIPPDFLNDRYDLYIKLSDIIHGDGGEEEAFKYFGILYTLVTSIISNVELRKNCRIAAQKFYDSKKTS